MTERYPQIEFSSVDELCSLIQEKTKSWDTTWYRGSQSSDHKLLPKLFRDAGQKEREQYRAIEFRRRARMQLPQIKSAFEWLCAMQHYGFATRLLDWSESLAVALYFTVRPVVPKIVSPTIWVLDPHALMDTVASGYGAIPIADTKIVRANADFAFDEEELDDSRTALPIPVCPDFLFQRLAAQNGAFTIHGTDERALEECIPKDRRGALLKFVAADSASIELAKSIELIKPSPDAIFPDLEGLAEYIDPGERTGLQALVNLYASVVGKDKK